MEKKSIKDWARSDRPREKMLEQGKASLSESELIAILIGSGNSKESAVELSKEILDSVGNNLIELSKLSIDQLMKFNGIGEAKAISIIAALELGNRRRQAEALVNESIKNSRSAYEYIYPYLSGLDHEEAWVVLVNRRNNVLRCRNISTGSTTASLVDPKIVFRFAIETPGCTGLFLFHNHPSDDPSPSTQDDMLTEQLKKGAKLMELTLVDHIIVSNKSYYSYADNDIKKIGL